MRLKIYIDEHSSTFIRRTLLHTVHYIRRMPMSLQIRLSYVTSVHPTHRVEVFSNIFAPYNSLGTHAVCVQILERNSNGFWVITQAKLKGGMKIGVFSTNISFYFENGKRYGHGYDERRIGTRMRSGQNKATVLFNIT